MTSENWATGAIRELTDQLGPSQVVTSGPAYEATCRIWNGGRDKPTGGGRTAPVAD